MTQNKVSKKIQNLMVQLDWFFGITNFERTITYKKLDESDDNYETVLSIHIDPIYRRININFFPVFFKKKPHEQRLFLLHEYCHTLTDETKSISEDFLSGKHTSTEKITEANERLTSTISILLDKLLLGNAKYASETYRKCK